MKKYLLLLIGLCLAVPALGAESPIVEAFGCTLKAGRTMADFDRAAAAWAAQADKLPSNKSYFAAVLKPFRGATGHGGTSFDLVWVGSNPSMDEWAKGQAAGMASADETAALAGIDATVSCGSALYQETTLYDGLKDEPSDLDAVIESYVCKAKPGKGQKDVDAAEAATVSASKALKLATYSAYKWAPLYDAADVQVVYLYVDDDWAAFATGFDKWKASKEGQAADAATAAALDCDSAIWLGHIIHQPATTNH